MRLPYGTSEDNSNFCRTVTGVPIDISFREPWCFTEKGPDVCNINYCGMYNTNCSVSIAEWISIFMSDSFAVYKMLIYWKELIYCIYPCLYILNKNRNAHQFQWETK